MLHFCKYVKRNQLMLTPFTVVGHAQYEYPSFILTSHNASKQKCQRAKTVSNSQDTRFGSVTRKMMSPTLIIVISVTAMTILSGEASGALPAQCNSGFLEELPPRLRKICIAIARIWDIRDINDFIDDKEYRENLPRYDSAIKRQDVDHVFLRFGKRR
ncbi:hypothetical protein HN011_010633 [Eciton burchellii]|nr:hypothetical protein HN011_010633 [Eciton burchellii]